MRNQPIKTALYGWQISASLLLFMLIFTFDAIAVSGPTHGFNGPFAPASWKQQVNAPRLLLSMVRSLN
jgi:hypothetical protein